jgi:hypothetical protein
MDIRMNILKHLKTFAFSTVLSFILCIGMNEGGLAMMFIMPFIITIMLELIYEKHKD